jgi:hypothetical protein
MAGLVRTYQNSHFDHVGMVLKFETDEEEIYIIDATSSGVKLTKWRFLRDHVGQK